MLQLEIIYRKSLTNRDFKNQHFLFLRSQVFDNSDNHTLKKKLITYYILDFSNNDK